MKIAPAEALPVAWVRALYMALIPVLCAALVMAVAVSDVSAEAKVTQAEAVAWAEDKADKKEKVGSGQCVALIYAYYQYLGYKVVYGNATDFQNNALPDKEWKRIKNSDGFKPKPGDIAVWAGNSDLNQYYTLGPYGHVGIVRSGNATEFKSVEQHVNGLYTQYCTRPTSYVTCWIRPKWKAVSDVPADESGTAGGSGENDGSEGGEQAGENGEEVEKLKNTLSVKARKLTVKRSALRRTRSYKVSKVLTVKGAKGKVTYKKLKGSKKITISKTSGKVTIKKKLKKGTYSIKVKVSAKGNDEYKAASRTVTFKVRVK